MILPLNTSPVEIVTCTDGAPETTWELVKIIPLLQNELTKMNRDNYDITSPMIAEITQKDCEDTHQSMQDFMNNYMAELVDNDLTIIDFGINYIDSNTKIGYIKYNRR